ncbi:MAG: hypothetical protein KYX61_04330 [Gammaproteobacteria bacterium]|jgi:hypothetical protein|nr:hypothetical protein [Gammaproteobacteria bacterium]
MSLPSGQSHAAGVLRLLQLFNHDLDVLELQWFSAWVVGNHVRPMETVLSRY